MRTTPATTTPRTRRLQAGIAGLALAAGLFVAPGLAGATNPPAPNHPTDISDAPPAPGPTVPKGPGDLTTPPPSPGPTVPGDLTNPEPDEDDCNPILASCDLTSNPGQPGDDGDGGSGSGGSDAPQAPDAAPDVEGRLEVVPQAPTVDVQPAVADAPVPATPTFTG